MNELEKEVTSKMTLICYTKLINKCNEKENQNNNNNKKKNYKQKNPLKAKLKDNCDMLLKDFMLISGQLIKKCQMKSSVDKCRICRMKRKYSKYKKSMVCSTLVITTQERGYQGRVLHKIIKQQI